MKDRFDVDIKPGQLIKIISSPIGYCGLDNSYGKVIMLGTKLIVIKISANQTFGNMYILSKPEDVEVINYERCK